MNEEITINTGGENYELEPVYTCNDNCNTEDVQNPQYDIYAFAVVPN
ncbi:hypothetical protein [Halobacillus sp. A5]|nr:hypothetical protein [Halobacillus sp. A5]